MREYFQVGGRSRFSHEEGTQGHEIGLEKGLQNGIGEKGLQESLDCKKRDVLHFL